MNEVQKLHKDYISASENAKKPDINKVEVSDDAWLISLTLNRLIDKLEQLRLR